MAATTTLLGLVTPTQGTLTGTWGDTVNYGISDYLDIAIAGTLSFAGDGAITLANTTGSSSGNSIGATTAQYAIIRVTGTLTTAKIITGPSYSKTYLVVNAATGSTVTFKASGQTGVSIAVGETALVYYNGTDYVKVVGTATAGAAGGSTTQVQYNNSGVLAGITGATSNGTALTLVAPVLGTPASGTVTNLTGTASININGTVGATTPGTGAFTTLTTSSTVTINGGTANGVAFLDASKVLTTGSALTFDGTDVGIGGAPATGLALRLLRTSGGAQIRYQNTAATWDAGNTASGAFEIFSAANTSIQFGVNATEQMRLNSTGLQVTNTLSGGTSGTAYSFSGSAPATSLTLNSSGNLGLAYAPNAWGSTWKAIRVEYYGAISSSQTDASINLTSNAYNNGTNWIYTETAVAPTLFTGKTSGFQWNIAPAGTAGNAISFTQAMTLDASGNLGVGTSSPAYKLDVDSTGGTVASLNSTNANGPGLRFARSGTANGYVGSAKYIVSGGALADFGIDVSGANNLIFGTNDTERARIDSSGNLLVGKTSTGLGTAGIEIFGAGYGQFTASGDASLFTNRLGSDGNTVQFYRATSLVGSISVTTLLTSYNTTSDYRLKTVVGAVSDSGSRIDALQPIEYTWNSNGSRTRGFLAHQFQEVYASSVTGTKDAVDADGKPVYQGMQAGTAEVIADLVAELQSLRARVAQLESKP